MASDHHEGDVARSMADLNGVRVKLTRAESHIRELHEALVPLGAAATSSIVCEETEDPSKIVYRVGRIPPIPHDLSAIVGDAAFNIRSAWDHLAWQLVLLDGKTPMWSTQFPICRSDPSPRSLNLDPKVDRADILEAIVEVQPYRRTNPWDSALFALNELNKIDKHRLLLTMAGTLDWDGDPPNWGVPDDVPSPVHRWPRLAQPLRSGDVIVEFDFLGVPAPADFEPNLAITVALDEGPQWMRIRSAAELLHGFLGMSIIHINWPFVRLFPDETPIPGVAPLASPPT